jgi:hypothetical protein
MATNELPALDYYFRLWPEGRLTNAPVVIFDWDTEAVYDACYTWRKIAHVNDIWSQLPNELIEQIAQSCIVRRRIQYQPSGTVYRSRIHEYYVDFT